MVVWTDGGHRAWQIRHLRNVATTDGSVSLKVALFHHDKSERVFMQLESELLENNVIRIVLDGRLDIEGAQAIDSQFSALAATRKARIVVDMAKVGFLASVGIRTLLSCAKTSSAFGGKMVLYGVQPLVMDVLETTGVTTLIPVVEDQKMALQLVNDI